MSGWTPKELQQINAEEYFQLAAALPDGSTPKWVSIWSVPVNDRIFIRSYHGTAGKWYGPALESALGRVSAGGVTKEVRFVVIEDEATNQAIDASYRTKYDPSPYAVTMSTDPVRSNTLEVIPLT